MGLFSKPDPAKVERIAEAMVKETNELVHGHSDDAARRATAERAAASQGATSKELNLAVDQHNKRC